MKKKKVHHKAKPKASYVMVIRSWTLLVMFALMLGLGAVVGTYLNTQSNISSPTVAGAETSR